MQVQASYKRESAQLKIHKTHLGILNPSRQAPRLLRNEYEQALAENASLKTAAAGKEEVLMLVQLATAHAHSLAVRTNLMQTAISSVVDFYLVTKNICSEA